MRAEPGLTDQEQELIAIGAAVASGCRPCLAYHIKAARAAGVHDEQMREAVKRALDVCRTATDAMARLADKYLGEVSTADPGASVPDDILGELVAAAAAHAANCTAATQSHVSAAAELGATAGQAHRAFDIARAVKAMAGKKVEEAAGRLVPRAACCLSGEAGAGSAEGVSASAACDCRDSSPAQSA